VLTPSEATAIIAGYMTLLANGIVEGTTVIDAASLPHAKLQILNAAALLMSLSADPSEKASLSTAACSLAFFQPGTAGAMHHLDEIHLHGETWGSLVKAEMEHIALTLPTTVGDRPSI
jgi:hypothetical protein